MHLFFTRISPVSSIPESIIAIFILSVFNLFSLSPLSALIIFIFQSSDILLGLISSFPLPETFTFSSIPIISCFFSNPSTCDALNVLTLKFSSFIYFVYSLLIIAFSLLNSSYADSFFNVTIYSFLLTFSLLAAYVPTQFGTIILITNTAATTLFTIIVFFISNSSSSVLYLEQYNPLFVIHACEFLFIHSPFFIFPSDLLYS